MNNLFEIEKSFIDCEKDIVKLSWGNNQGIEIRNVYIKPNEILICFTTNMDIFDKNKIEFEAYNRAIINIIENIFETYDILFTRDFSSSTNFVQKIGDKYYYKIHIKGIKGGIE